MGRESGLNRRMSDKHEADLATWLNGRVTRGSGNQAANPMDGRNNRYKDVMAFCWDGKSTRAKSIGVSLAMWEKAKEQAHGERPALPLRFYSADRLSVAQDLIVLDLNDFIEMLELINGA